MTTEMIFELLCRIIYEVIPELQNNTITPSDSLKSLGANSIDRAEIIMLTMMELKIKIPAINFARAQNIEGIINIFQEHLINQDTSATI